MSNSYRPFVFTYCAYGGYRYFGGFRSPDRGKYLMTGAFNSVSKQAFAIQLGQGLGRILMNLRSSRVGGPRRP